MQAQLSRANRVEAAKAFGNEGRMLQLDDFETEIVAAYLEIEA